jgi:hypothetical protein
MKNILLSAVFISSLPTGAFAFESRIGGYHNTNINVNTAVAHSYASARAAARSTAYGGNARAYGGAGGSVVNAINTGNNTPWWGYGGSTAIAPAASPGVGVCSSTFGLALGFIGSFGISVPVSDNDCNERAWYVLLPPRHPIVKAKLACQSHYVHAAYQNAGYGVCDNVNVQ